MTFIQPRRNFNTANIILAVLIFSTVAATFGLVAVYNGIVNTSHNIAAVKAKLDQVGAQSTDLQNQIVGVLGSGAAAEVARSSGLIEDRTPRYLQTGLAPRQAHTNQWAFASQP